MLRRLCRPTVTAGTDETANYAYMVRTTHEFKAEIIAYWCIFRWLVNTVAESDNFEIRLDYLDFCRQICVVDA